MSYYLTESRGGCMESIARCCRQAYVYPVDSRKLLYAVGGVIGVILVAVIWSSGDSPSPPTTPSPLPTPAPQRGSIVLRQAPLIVGSNYFLTNLKNLVHNQVSLVNFNQSLKNDEKFGNASCKSCQTDLWRLKSGLVGSQVWSIDVPCTAEYKDAVTLTLEQIDAIKRLIVKYSSNLTLVTSSDELNSAFKGNQVGSILSVTSGHSIDGRMPVLRMFYDLGVRVMSLASSCNTTWSCSYNTTTDTGLSTFGKNVVKEMNRLGIVIDLSESSHKTQLDVLNITQTPVIFSHGAAFTQANSSSRNINDDVLDKLKTNQGLVMVTFAQKYINDSKNASIQSVIDQINYIKSKVGVGGVGIGAEFDAQSETYPSELSDVSTFPTLFDQLGNTWTNHDDLKNLAGGNLLRVIQAAEKYANESKNSPDETYTLEPVSNCYTDISSRSAATPSPSNPTPNPIPNTTQNPKPTGEPKPQISH